MILQENETVVTESTPKKGRVGRPRLSPEQKMERKKRKREKAQKRKQQQELGKKGGMATLKRHGKDHFRKIILMSNMAQGKKVDEEACKKFGIVLPS